MTESELQAEEQVVLFSIYDGDEAFKQVSPTVYQYKFGENEDIKSFLLEISWGPTYPTEKPSINLDTFYNRNLLQSIKDKIIDVVNNEAEQWLGFAMTYTLFECVKEKFNELTEEQVLVPPVKNTIPKEPSEDCDLAAPKKNTKKEHLTKGQKRRVWDRAEGGKGGDRPRGYDWVDIVKHLSQTAGAKPSTTSS